MAEEFKQGDKVRDQNDKRWMTVVSFDSNGEMAECGWRNDDGQPHFARFPTVMLTKEPVPTATSKRTH